MIAVALVERESRDVVDSSLKAHNLGFPQPQLLLSQFEERGPDTMTACFGANVNCDNVPRATSLLADNETNN